MMEVVGTMMEDDRHNDERSMIGILLAATRRSEPQRSGLRLLPGEFGVRQIPPYHHAVMRSARRLATALSRARGFLRRGPQLRSPAYQSLAGAAVGRPQSMNLRSRRCAVVPKVSGPTMLR
jgi:hypothetical protein